MHILHDTIGAPKLKIDKKSRTNAVLTIAPLPNGYGTTLGNALRRVLLSSLPGTAITAIKIPGVTHEFTSVDGMKDSVLDLILNIRQLKLKKHSKNAEVIELLLPKKGEVFAKDLKVSSDIEILDPTQLITVCDGVKTDTIHMRVEKGVGYEIVESTDSVKEEDPEYILVDANFSPVIRCKYKVEPARVGEQTNLDQLVLEVETDGSLDADNAIKLGAGMLESYFNLFSEEDAYTDEDFTTSFSAIRQKEEAEQLANSVAVEESFTPIDILGFSQRTLNALVNGGITSVEQLLKTPMSQLTQLRGFGQKAKQELDQVLQARGYVQANDGEPINL